MIAIEANDEWLVGRSDISQKSMATLRDVVPEKDFSRDQGKEVELIAASGRQPLHGRGERRGLTPRPGN